MNGAYPFDPFTLHAQGAVAASFPLSPATQEDDPMIRTIQVNSFLTARGRLVDQLPDGRIGIDTGERVIFGWPAAQAQAQAAQRPSFLSWLTRGLGVAVLATGAVIAADQAQAQNTLLNVSYDPTRELYREFNEVFGAWWVAQGHEAPVIEQSHGGSGSQARAVIDGLQAQVVTLALAGDIDAIVENTDLIPEDWQSRLPHNASPYTSTIVFLVREGNPEGISDWGDLVKEGIEVITPNPKTSGGARWNYLAAWAWAEANGQDPQAFVGDLYRNVPVLDSGARGSTTTFVQRGIGDVLLAWENEAYLALAELGDDQFDIIVPSVSILAEPPVAIVEGNIASDDQRALAEAYLNFLYTPEGQAVAYKNYYRGWDASAANPEDVARFPELSLVTIADFGGWGEVQPAHFGDGGIFDQIYTAP